MQDIKLKSLGMEGVGQEPSTVDEFDQIAKKPGTALTRACEYVRFHITLGEIRNLFLHGQAAVAATESSAAVEAITGVEEETKIARNTTPVLKDGKPVMKDGEAVTEYDETEGKYFARVIATLVKDGQFPDEDSAKASFQPLFDQVIKAVGFPAAASERKASGPKKLAAKYKLSAAITIALGNIDKVNTTFLSQINKSFTATGDSSKMFSGKTTINKNGTPTEVDYNVSDKDAESLGWLLKEYQDFRSAQELLTIGS